MRSKRSSHCDFTPSFGRKKKKRKQNATHSSVAAQTAAQFDTSFLGATRIESTGQKLHYRLMLQKILRFIGKVTLPPWLISPSLWVQISSLFSWSKTFVIGHPFTETDIYQLVNGSHRWHPPSEKRGWGDARQVNDWFFGFNNSPRSF